MVRVTHAHVTELYLNQDDKITHISVKGIARMEINGNLTDHEEEVIIRAIPVNATNFSSVEVVKN